MDVARKSLMALLLCTSLGPSAAHAEDPVSGGAYCDKCGRVEAGTANPEFHPEAYLP